MNILYSVLMIVACILFICFAQQKSKTGKSDFTIAPFFVAWLIFLIPAAFLFVFIRFGMDQISPKAGKSKSAFDSADKYLQGKKIFQAKCSACHVAPEKPVTDQLAFDNLFDRLPKPSEDYFIQFIKNGKVLKASGDKYALKLAEIWDTKYDHAFQDSLSNQDLENLIVYIKEAMK
jgi:mono/diheme cytochrome c family protein